MEPAVLEALLAQSRRNNAHAQITGMLVHAAGDFLQVLEGPPAAVEALFQLISQDPRHEQCRVLSDVAAEARVFADWNMGFEQVRRDELALLPGFCDFFNPDLTPRPLEGPTSAAQFLLLGFRSLALERGRR
jgi:hypothetical protein